MNDDGRRDAELRLSESGDNDERRSASVDARTVALVVLAVGVIPFALYAGAAFFIAKWIS